MLQIADNLKLNKDAVTGTIIVYGGKGMGKTVFGAVLAEELAANHLRFSILDPVGRSWGLRFAANGKGPGLDILILGGRHGDIPIEPTGGAIVADLVADENVDTLVDISCKPNGEGWSHGEKIRFTADYCTRLYQKQQIRTRPMMQIIDEAGRFVPQQIPHGAIDVTRCIGAIEQLVELGRNAAVGVCLITQRSARMNKSVSELAECMIAFRTIGPNSIDSIMDWFGEHVDKSRWKELLARLREQDVGEALVVSPGWLKYEGMAKIRMRHTFDSSATPKGKTQHRASGGRQPDLKKYAERMTATIEKAKAEDPKELKKIIADLQRQLKTKDGKVGRLSALDERAGETSIELKKQNNELRRSVAHLENQIARNNKSYADIIDRLANKVQGPLTQIVNEQQVIADVFKTARAQFRGIAELVTVKPISRVKHDHMGNYDHPPIPKRPIPSHSVPSNGAEKLPAGEMKILTAIIQHGNVERNQLSVLTGYKKRSRDTYLQRLGQRGLVEINSDKRIEPTQDACLKYSNIPPLPTGRELREHLEKTLPIGEWKILSYAISAYPASVERNSLSEATGYALRSRDTYIQRLSARQLLNATGTGQVKASDALFEDY